MRLYPRFVFLSCLLNCYCQSCIRYHVPRSWFKPSGNVLVILEEKGGDPTKIKFSKRVFSSICSHVVEDYHSIDLDLWKETDENGSHRARAAANAHLRCPPNTKMHTVRFASYGNPTGSCGSYSLGSCHDLASTAIVEKVSIDLFDSFQLIYSRLFSLHSHY